MILDTLRYVLGLCFINGCVYLWFDFDGWYMLLDLMVCCIALCIIIQVWFGWFPFCVVLLGYLYVLWVLLTFLLWWFGFALDIFDCISLRSLLPGCGLFGICLLLLCMFVVLIGGCVNVCFNLVFKVCLF